MTEEVTHMVVPEIMTGTGREIHTERSHLWIMRETDMKGTVTCEKNGRVLPTSFTVAYVVSFMYIMPIFVHLMLNISLPTSK